MWARLVLAAVALPLAAVLAVLPGRHRRWAVTRAAARTAVRLTGAKVQIHNGHMPPPPTVVVANHASWADPVLLGAILPGTVRFLAGAVLLGNPIQALVLRRAGAILVDRHSQDRSGSTTARLVDALGQGDTVVVFPEGALDETPGLRTFHLGAFAAAAEAHVPVVPIALRGTRQVVPPGTRQFRRGTVDVVVGEPLRALGSEEDAVWLRDAARAHIARHCGEPDR